MDTWHSFVVSHRPHRSVLLPIDTEVKRELSLITVFALLFSRVEKRLYFLIRSHQDKEGPFPLLHSFETLEGTDTPVPRTPRAPCSLSGPVSLYLAAPSARDILTCPVHLWGAPQPPIWGLDSVETLKRPPAFFVLEPPVYSNGAPTSSTQMVQMDG